MQLYRIHRMKDAPRQQFRWAPHVSGTANVKPKDYDPSSEVEAEDEYDAWARLRNSATPLHVGDLLETTAGKLRICKYVGFDDANWIVPDNAAHGHPAPVPGVLTIPPSPVSQPVSIQ